MKTCPTCPSCKGTATTETFVDKVFSCYECETLFSLEPIPYAVYRSIVKNEWVGENIPEERLYSFDFMVECTSPREGQTIERFHGIFDFETHKLVQSG